MSKQIEGILKKNDSGRYELDGTYEFTSGYPIEFYYAAPVSDKNMWVKTSIEHDGIDYYLVKFKHVQLQGLQVRVPE